MSVSQLFSKPLRMLLWSGIILLSSCISLYQRDDTMCTEEYRTITVKITDQSGIPVKLDRYRTVKSGSNDTINFSYDPYMDSIYRSQGIYVLITDGYMYLTNPGGLEFHFIGWKENQVVVDEPYIIAHDRCHVIMRSGRNEIVLP